MLSVRLPLAQVIVSMVVYGSLPTSGVSYECAGTGAVLSGPNPEPTVSASTEHHHARREEATGIHVTQMPFQMSLHFGVHTGKVRDP